MNIKQEHHHRAVDDARVTAEVFLRFVEMLEEKDVHTLAKLNDMGAMSPDLIKKAPSYHGIILVKNETGRINLNRLVTASHLDYFNPPSENAGKLDSKVQGRAYFRVCL